MKKHVILGYFLFFAQSAFVAAQPQPVPPAPAIDLSPYTQELPDWFGTVESVADGDTFSIRFYTKPQCGVRPKGIDCPESKDTRKPLQYWALEAQAYTADILKPGTIIRLAFKGDLIDRYGRLLAYVYYWNGKEWIFFQEEMLKKGMAVLYFKYPFEYPLEFFRYQQEAVDNRRGMWAHPELIESEFVTTIEELRERAPWFKGK